MQFTAVIVALFAASAVAYPQTSPNPAIELTDADVAELATAAKADLATADLAAARIDLNAQQCAVACRGGVTVARAFCRLIPNPIAKGACLVVAAAAGTEFGQNACVNFCDDTF